MNAQAMWLNPWISGFSFAESVPQWLLTACGLVLIYCLVIVPSGAVMGYLERKLSADFQARVGPNRAGPAGVLQPVADLLKLLQKQASRDWNWREAIWLLVHTMALYSTVAVIPLGSLLLLVDTDMSAFLPFWSALVLALGTMFLGLSQGSVPGWFGGIRVAAQALAGAFPALIALLCAGIRAGGFRWSEIAAAQSSSPLLWTAAANPFQFIAFFVFVISGLVLLGIPPMDAAFSAPDIHGGVSSHLSGRKLTVFRLGRFYGFLLWSVIAVVLFLGGWELPFGLSTELRNADSPRLLQIFELCWLLSKTFLLVLVVTWIAKVNPRSRVDQVTDFAWRVLSPFSLVALIGASLVAGWGAL
ncbi:MAG: hypothetical protein A2428_04680 [Bdellovibrionales bacterium RIFOXYC1_FULL_54_43]|nr:MAG: hypothetical protein A2428_04680 [Bdellovibrionales bacterium RIFOXYC1_FULL_54_43]OFZ78859.1 MAG: hypothetical protein A2603_08550 [Bdellovibrionales bacterium RIFOXYD1_FULL_55_31]